MNLSGFDQEGFKDTSIAALQPPTKKKQGGIAGFLGNVAHAAASPFEYLLNAAIVNPIKENSAILTGNKTALANAKKKSNENLGLGEQGTDFTGGLKKFVGNSAQALLTVAAPGASTFRKGAAIGTGTGAGSALAEKDSTVGDVLAGGLYGAATGGTLARAGKLLNRGARSGEKGGFMQNLTTQGQQMQARGLGISGGAKVAGKELTPQDTERILQTLRDEGIKTGNANSAARDLNTRLKAYGQQIANHFKANNAPLLANDTKVIGSNFIEGLKTTDPSVLKQADILAGDLQKNVKSTKDLWEFRKSLDSRIPDSKFMDEATSNKVTALKAMREYISKELGDIPGMQKYHDLSEAKPFLGKGMRELNQPSGGIVGRMLSSGPVQKTESILGKGAEKVGNLGAREVSQASEVIPQQNFLNRMIERRGIPVRFEDSTYTAVPTKQVANKFLINPSVHDAADAAAALKSNNFSVESKMGSLPARKSLNGTGGTSIYEQASPTSSIQLHGQRTALPFEQSGATTKGIINTPDVYKAIEELPVSEEVKRTLTERLGSTGIVPSASGFLGRMTRQGATNMAGQAAVPGQNDSAVPTDVQPPDTTLPPTEQNNLSAASQEQSGAYDPFAPENAQASVQQILAQGGKMKDVAEYLNNVKTLQDLSATNTKPIKKTETQRARDEAASLTDKALQQLDAGSVHTGLFSSKVEGVKNIFGAGDPETQAFNVTVNSLKAAIAKARAGTSFTPNEEALLNKYAPSSGDSGQMLRTKLKALQDVYQQASQREYGVEYQPDLVMQTAQ